MLSRTVLPEALDSLAEDDPTAVRSRRDLRRVHRAMGTRSILLRAMREMTAARSAHAPLRMLELGAGDGSLMLGVAGALAKEWPRVELTLLDRQALIDHRTLDAYARLGWTAVPAVADVNEWAGATADPLRRGGAGWDWVLANLFLHHFDAVQLAVLMRAISGRTDRFLACEPRRGRFALAGSHLIGAIGANAVTRQDAVLSVHAGFTGQEMTALWPSDDPHWQFHEHSAGLFSHCFRAVRSGVN